MSKHGIPRIDPEDKKSKHVTARFTESEYTELKSKAKASGTTVSNLVREGVVRVRAFTPQNRTIEKEKIRHIAKIGNNLNQLARAVNTQGVVNYELEILGILSSIEDKITNVLYSKGTNDAH